jgi:hypothetical protein
MPIKIGTSMNEITVKVIHSYFRVEPKQKRQGACTLLFSVSGLQFKYLVMLCFLKRVDEL